jgi:Zn-dependent peptidase ImmA (M78 family)
LPTLRSLTRKKHPQTFIAELTEKCAECGVAVVVVRAPKGCHASGATLFLTPQKAVLMLSFRHLSEDQFWFTFFHEAGHLVLHGSESLFVEWEQSHTSKEESEANDFAGNTLVPVESQPAMLALPARAMAIIRFAQKVGVSPGIIVGQMQHRERLKRDQLNRLKRWFEWADSGEVRISLGTS